MRKRLSLSRALTVQTDSSGFRLLSPQMFCCRKLMFIQGSEVVERQWAFGSHMQSLKRTMRWELSKAQGRGSSAPEGLRVTLRDLGGQ